MLAEAVHTAPGNAQIIAALREASAETGSDFHYLLGTAMRESGLKSDAKSNTSSACGLFQFVDQTWLGMIRQNGAKFGLGAYAQKIATDGTGHFTVTDKADREAILALRKDPRVSALMEGEFCNQTKAALQSALGRNVCDGELYAAHFLGPAAATRLIEMNQSTPQADAVDAFPLAASANRNVFYRADGSAKTVREVYGWALKQPSGGAPEAAPGIKAVAASAATPAAGDGDTLLNLLAWAPARPAFGALDDESALKSFDPMGFLLSPGVMDVLTGLHPSQG